MPKPPASNDSVTKHYKSAHNAGDPFAHDECVVLCVRSGVEFPDWVREELAERSRQRLFELDRHVRRANPKLPSLIGHLVSDWNPPLKRRGGPRPGKGFIRHIF